MNIDGPKITYKCSKCGSTDIGKPIGNKMIEAKCFKCGHVKYKPTATGGRDVDWIYRDVERIVEI